MLDIAHHAGVRVALSTIPVNQADHAPFISSSLTELSPAQEKLWENSMDQGKQLVEAGLHAAARRSIAILWEGSSVGYIAV